MRDRVCVMTVVHSPFDTRIFHKEVCSLLRSGYRVVLMAVGAAVEAGDMTIAGTGGTAGRLQRLVRSCTAVPWRALRAGARLYHLHDPELLPAGLLLKACGRKVVYDMHELPYYQIRDHYWLKNRLVNRLCRELYLLFEKAAVRFFDGIVLAEDGYRPYFDERYPACGRTAVVRNYPLLPLIDAVPAPPRRQGGKAVVLYAGTIADIRGVREMVEAAALLGGRAELWLVGEWDSEDLKSSCGKLRGWRYTRVFGRVPPEEVYRFMKRADVGLAVLHPVRNHLTSLPVKAFEYMACGVPMVLSDFPLWRQAFAGCARFADPRDPADIARGIGALLADGHAARRQREAALRAVRRFSWRSEETKLLELYGRILRRSGEQHGQGQRGDPVPQ